MIDENIKIHDRFTVEMKMGFSSKGKARFNVNTWFFVPSSLDINRQTYTKGDFYKDIKSNIRLITPVFLLNEIANDSDSPIASIKKSLEDLQSKGNASSLKELQYQFKMFSSILKSSMRENIRVIKKIKDEKLKLVAIVDYIDSIKDISIVFRRIEKDVLVLQKFPKANDFFQFSDEFMSLLIENACFKLLKEVDKKPIIKKEVFSVVTSLLKHELVYKTEKGYATADENSSDNNRSLISRYGMLKKYTESELFLNKKVKEDAFLFKQFVYSLAAGLSMIFATVVAFSFQQEYGNFTMPFFIALVVGYMLKDRIKELSRYYFAHKLSNKHFDLKTLITLGKDKIGFSKESFDYIKNDKLPAEIIKLRNRSKLIEFNSEQIMLYRMQIETDSSLINKHTDYKVEGINNIVRYNIAGLTDKMDNPEVPLCIYQEDGVFKKIKGDKVYYINMLLQIQHDKQSEIKHYRLVINRDGIKKIEKIKEKP